MLELKFNDGKEYKLGELSLYNLAEAEELRDKEKIEYTDLQWSLHLLYSSFQQYNPETEATYKDFLKMFPLEVYKENQNEILKLIGGKNFLKEVAKKKQSIYQHGVMDGTKNI